MTTVTTYTDDRVETPLSDYAKSIQTLVESHGMRTMVRHGRLQVEEVYTSDKGTFSVWLDATLWSIKDTFDWLGY